MKSMCLYCPGQDGNKQYFAIATVVRGLPGHAGLPLSVDRIQPRGHRTVVWLIWWNRNKTGIDGRTDDGRRWWCRRDEYAVISWRLAYLLCRPTQRR